MSSLWVAQEGGYFKREGLDTELLYIGGGSLLIQSMLSGDVPFAYGPSVPVINASLRGSDLVLIGNTGNSLVFSIMSRPEIKQPAKSQGQKSRCNAARRFDGLGVGRGFEAMGIGARPRSDRDSDRRYAGRFGGVDSRRARCGGAFAAEQFRAVKAGMHELVDVGQLRHYFSEYAAIDDQNLSSNRTGTRRCGFCAALPRDFHRLRTDKEFSMKVLSKYTKVTDAETLGATASNLRRALQRRSHSLRARRRVSTKFSSALPARKRAKQKPASLSTTAC